MNLFSSLQPNSLRADCNHKLNRPYKFSKNRLNAHPGLRLFIGQLSMMGSKAYRCRIAWPEAFPTGPGRSPYFIKDSTQIVNTN